MKAGFVAARTSCPFGIGHLCLQTKPRVHGGSALWSRSAERETFCVSETQEGERKQSGELFSHGETLVGGFPMPPSKARRPMRKGHGGTRRVPPLLLSNADKAFVLIRGIVHCMLAEGVRGNKRCPFPSSKGHICQRRSAKAFAFARQCSANSNGAPAIEQSNAAMKPVPAVCRRACEAAYARKGRGETCKVSPL